MAKVLGDILQVRVNAHPVVRPYTECMEIIIGSGYLTYADGSQLTIGKKIRIRADGRGNEPRCMCAKVERPGKVEIATGDKQYAHHMRDFKEILSKSIDTPILLQYSETECRSDGSSDTSSLAANGLLLGMKAGKCAQTHHVLPGE